MDIISYVQGLIKKLKGNDKLDEKAVLDKVNAINGENSVPERPKTEDAKTYDRLEYDYKSDDEIFKQAADSLSGYVDAGMKGVDNEIDSLKAKYETDRQNNSASYDKTVKSLNEAYEKAIEAANNDALKRGLARSSVAANTAAAIEAGRAEKVTDAEAEFRRADAAINEQLSGLEVKRQKALDDFNISYTAKLTEEINRLKKAQEELKTAAVKYNNSLTEKENKDKLDRQKAESDLYSEALDQAKKEIDLKNHEDEATKDMKYQEIYNTFRDSLLTLSAQEAYNEIHKNGMYRRYLSDAYFYKLYDEFGR